MEKTYSILIQFGDGNPVESQMRAKDGIEAQDKAFLSHPGARSVRITGVLEVHNPPPPIKKQSVIKKAVKEHPLFTDIGPIEIASYVNQSPVEERLAACQQLRSEGLSYRAIAKQMKMGETTVRTWLKNTLPS